MFSCEFCEIFKNTFCIEHLRVTEFFSVFLKKLFQKISQNSQGDASDRVFLNKSMTWQTWYFT